MGGSPSLTGLDKTLHSGPFSVIVVAHSARTASIFGFGIIDKQVTGMYQVSLKVVFPFRQQCCQLLSTSRQDKVRHSFEDKTTTGLERHIVLPLAKLKPFFTHV